MEVVNSYDGPGFVQNEAPGQRRKTSKQAIKESHRDLMTALEKNGKIALNASDFERTMHLPVGKGRLACDEDGEFDKNASRPMYNERTAPRWPMHLHSTVTEGESKEVKDQDEMERAIATNLWSIKPLERIRRFRLTKEDQLENLQLQVEGERAARLAIERKMGIRPEAGIVNQEIQDRTTSIEVATLKEENRMLNEKFEMLMRRLGDGVKSEEDEKPKPVGKGK